jgi:RimJ/RimL family protein N-acetyltransferase
LRDVEEEDCRQLWKWRNDPKVRKASFSPKAIDWKEHVKWFKSRLGDPKCVMYIATTVDGASIGGVRYDIENGDAVISVIIDQRSRAMGYGRKILCLASRRMFNSTTVKRVHAYVKEDNTASIAAFARAGFKNMGMTTFHGHDAIHLILDRDEADWKAA